MVMEDVTDLALSNPESEDVTARAFVRSVQGAAAAVQERFSRRVSMQGGHCGLGRMVVELMLATRIGFYPDLSAADAETMQLLLRSIPSTLLPEPPRRGQDTMDRQNHLMPH